MKLHKLLVVGGVVLLAAVCALAQTTPDVEQGMKPYGSYHGGDLDHISLSKGNLFFHADLMAYSQSGGELAGTRRVQSEASTALRFPSGLLWRWATARF